MLNRSRRVASLLFVLAALFLCCAAVVCAADQYTVNVDFYDYDKVTPHAYEGSSTNLWIYLEIKDKATGNVVGWNRMNFNPKNNCQTSFSLSFNQFGSISHSGYVDNNISFNDSLYEVSYARLYSTEPTYHLVNEELQDYEKRPNDTVDGCKFMDAVNITDTGRTLRLQRWNGSHLYIDIYFDPSLTTEISESDRYYVRAELTHTTGNPTYFVAPLVTAGTNNPQRI